MLCVIFQNCGPFEAVHPEGADDEVEISSVLEKANVPENVVSILNKGQCYKCHSDILYNMDNMPVRDLVIENWIDKENPSKSIMYESIHPSLCQDLKCDNQEPGCCMPPRLNYDQLLDTDIDAVKAWLDNLEEQIKASAPTDTSNADE